MYIHIAKKDLGDMCGFDKPQIVCEKMRKLEIEMIHWLFLVIAMYCQASSSQFNQSKGREYDILVLILSIDNKIMDSSKDKIEREVTF